MTSQQTVPDESPSRTIRPEPRLSGRGLTLSLLLACFVPLLGLTIYAIIAGGAFDKPLPVTVSIDRRLVPMMGIDGAVMADVVVINNQSDQEIPRLTIDLNGQYFLHQDKPLGPREELVLPQAIFSTKSNQRWVPGKYPLTEVTVTGQLPSRSRGVLEYHPPLS
jgi:hypothetical protein